MYHNSILPDMSIPVSNIYSSTDLIADVTVEGGCSIVQFHPQAPRRAVPTLQLTQQGGDERLQNRTAVASWSARRYANPKVRGSNHGRDRLRIFSV